MYIFFNSDGGEIDLEMDTWLQTHPWQYNSDRFTIPDEDFSRYRLWQKSTNALHESTSTVLIRKCYSDIWKLMKERCAGKFLYFNYIRIKDKS